MKDWWLGRKFTPHQYRTNWPNSASKNSQTRYWPLITNWVQITTWTTIQSQHHYCNTNQTDICPHSMYFHCRPFKLPCLILCQPWTFHEYLAYPCVQSNAIHWVFGPHHHQGGEGDGTPGNDGLPSLSSSGRHHVYWSIRKPLISHWDWPYGWSRHLNLPVLLLWNDPGDTQNNEPIFDEALSEDERVTERHIPPPR